MSDTLISPGADHAIRKRVSSYKRKAQSPNFRDILRQRCRERVRAKRGALFDRLRNLHSEESVRNALSQYINSDLGDLQSSFSLRKMGSEDVMDVEDQPLSSMAESERERWILSEYERLITNAQVELMERVACPMCDRGVLRAHSDTRTITCSQCSLMLPLQCSLSQVEQLIARAVDSHESACPSVPMFTVCPDSLAPSLMLLCTQCNCFDRIM